MSENTATELGQIGFAAYYERTGGAPLKMPESWDMQHEDVRADWEAAAVAIAAHGAGAPMLSLYREALERLADEDTCVLGEGLGGGPQEELHVRASFAAHTLGRDTCDCTECQVSLGLEPDDEDLYEGVATQGLHAPRADVDL